MLLMRLLYAHRLLLDPGYTVEDVAVKLGYGKVRTLQRHLRAVFRLSAGELRASLSFEDALALVYQRFFEGRHAAVS
jgi:transcriptional regulator GlxA family with amidase domain